MKFKGALLILFACAVLHSCTTRSSLPENLQALQKFDVIIKNGLVVDGSGKPGYPASIIIQADTIAFIGQLDSTRTATLEIDANGKVVTPGFIDAHAHGDPIKTPQFYNFVAQGVTTICLGQDGSSDSEGEFGAWQASVDSVGPALNIAPFTGHGSLRMAIETPFDEVISEEDMAMMATELDHQLQLGSFGLTMGLEYVPGRYSGEKELQALAKIVGSYQGVLMAHIRNEDNDKLEDSLDEFLSLGQWAPVHVSHLKSVYGEGAKRALEITSILAKYELLGYRVSADVYPYMASFTGIGIVFPDWAIPPANFNKVKKTRRGELEEFLRNKIAQRNGPAATLFGTAPYAGKTLADLEKELDKPFEDILIDDIGPRGASAAYFVMNDSLQVALMKSDYVVVSSDGSPGMRHPRGYGSFGKMIETYTVKGDYFTLEQIVHKMSGQTAEVIGLKDRGLLKVGYKADVAIFDPANVKVKADFQHPHHLTEGVDFVLVNGKLARSNGEFAEERTGKLLRRE
ncbi:amidohydrolase family protein [uncultured Imperialibacter sp.]|uniref:N-acyl-D-amino-acid deacylase family protein n=1 Tax=uncultured Imperialibacter sp. TaxID=1672639 RepID=UPI0030D6DC77|tara:strand:- start:21294 stop:22838 length:1545 start_codon:yes stop_codon:yes gene_type:complete